MAVWTKLINPFTSIIQSALDKIGGDKIDEETRERLKLEAIASLQTYELDVEAAFRDFVIEYEGAAKDMPRFIQVLRGTVRPLITYAAFIMLCVGFWQSWPEEPLSMLYKLNLVTLVFWFGEKALTRTGIAQVLRRNGNGSNH